jgi:hypothetical protein
LHAPERSAGLKATNKEKQSWERIPKERINKRKTGESKLTFNLLLLPLEGLARLLGLALQLEKQGLLLLEGLA